VGDPDLGEGLLLEAGAAEQTGGGAWAKDLGRMGIKRGNDGCAMVLRGVLLGCSDNLLMPEVDAIKHTHGKGERAGEGRKGVDGAKNLHAWER